MLHSFPSDPVFPVADTIQTLTVYIYSFPHYFPNYYVLINYPSKHKHEYAWLFKNSDILSLCGTSPTKDDEKYFYIPSA